MKVSICFDDDLSTKTNVPQGYAAESRFVVRIGGKHITASLQQLIINKNPALAAKLDEYTCADIKEKLAYVFNGKELGMGVYTFPDGTQVNIDEERYKCCEVLFSNGVTKNNTPFCQHSYTPSFF